MRQDASLPDIGKWFRERDITCLLYDPRGIGASDGQPRNDASLVTPESCPSFDSYATAQTDARQQTEDLHDIVTWLIPSG
jgi:hypothetical protein